MRNFTIEDFDGAGQYLVRSKSNYIHESGALSTLMMKIGYQYRGKRGSHTIYMIAMSDGLIFDGYNYNDEWFYWEGNEADKSGTQLPKQKLADYLNDPTKCEQEYRFATQEEIVRVVMYQKGRWRN